MRWREGLALMDDEAPVRQEGLERLRRIGGDALVERMVAAFRDYAPRQVALAEAGLASANLDAVRRAAHALKSSAGNLGAVRLMDIAQRTERLAREGGAEDVRPLVAELGGLVEGVIRYLDGRVREAGR